MSISSFPQKSTRNTKRDRNFYAPRGLSNGGLPRKVPEGKFIWHNHVQHCVGMRHGRNGFRCWNGLLPIDYRTFERCRCGWIDLPHYKIRGLGSGKCVRPEQIYPLTLAELNRDE